MATNAEVTKEFTDVQPKAPTFVTSGEIGQTRTSTQEDAPPEVSSGSAENFERNLRNRKAEQTAATTALTRKKNELLSLIQTVDNLHLVKDGIGELTDRHDSYIIAHDAFIVMLQSDEEIAKEEERHDRKQTDFLQVFNSLNDWVRQAEARLNDEISEGKSITSRRSSRRSSKASTGLSQSSAKIVSSARLKERARVAELEAERSMLHSKQEAIRKHREAEEFMQQQLEQLKLDTEILKSKAKEKVYTELLEEDLVDFGDGMNEYCERGAGQSVADNVVNSPNVPVTIITPNVPVTIMTPSVPVTIMTPNVPVTMRAPVASVVHSLNLPTIPLPTFESSQVVRPKVYNPSLSSLLQPIRSSDATYARTYAPKVVHTSAQPSLPVPIASAGAARMVTSASNFSLTHDVPVSSCAFTSKPNANRVPTYSGNGISVNHPDSSNVLNPLVNPFVPGLPSGAFYDDITASTLQGLASAMLLPQAEISHFNGNPLEYRSFMLAFNARIAQRTTSSADKLYFLYQYLSGDAKELIAGCMQMAPDEGFNNAQRLLEKEYGHPYKVAVAYIDKLMNWHTINYDDIKALQRFAAFLNQCLSAMSSYDDLTVLNHVPNMQCIVQKLPVYVQNKWRDHVAKLRTQGCYTVHYSELVKFVDSVVDSANDPIFGKEALKRAERSKTSAKEDFSMLKKPKKQVSSFVTRSTVPSSDKVCVVCDRLHDIEECNVFDSKSLKERREFIIEKKLCFACLDGNHISKFCNNKRICKTCSKCHPTKLHDDSYKFAKINKSTNASHVNASSDKGTNVTVNTCASHASETVVLHGILPVLVSHKDSNVTVATYALYDNGSSGCFITQELTEELNVTGDDTALQLKTMHGTSRVPSKCITGLQVRDIKGNNLVTLPKTFQRIEIPVNKNQIPRPEFISGLQHLSAIAHEIPAVRDNINVGLLIGSNCPLALEPLKIVSSNHSGPYAMLLRHGWTIYGPLHVNTKSNEVVCNRVIVHETDVRELVINMFESDFSERVGLPDERGLSEEDKKFMDIVDRCTQFENDHYVIPLPFRADSKRMPDNREQALTRVTWQRKKMKRDPVYHKEYAAFMNNMLDKGYAVQLRDNQLNAPDGATWYIPHHGVYHPQKKKLRVVFDCGATCNGTFLNAQLLQGPNLTSSLVGVLTRFRQHRIAFMADIESMYYRVQVPVEQQDYLRFLWWPGGNIDSEVQEYRMTVHLFGAVSSPSIANYALRRTAKDFSEGRHPDVYNSIHRNFYVDDLLKSVNNVQDAVDIATDLIATCQSGGFKLTKFVSNCDSLLDSIPKDLRAEGVSSRDLAKYDGTERALGLFWQLQSDAFTFRIDVKQRPSTRRGILSALSAIYDPLGFLAPVILPAKRILQQLCKTNNLDWDDSIPEEFLPKWCKWLTDLPKLNDILVPLTRTRSTLCSCMYFQMPVWMVTVLWCTYA